MDFSSAETAKNCLLELHRSSERLPADVFERLSAMDLDVRGALHSLLSERGQSVFDPSLANSQLFDFLLDYYLDALLNEELAGDWTHEPYPAALECYAWVKQWQPTDNGAATKELARRLLGRYLRASKEGRSRLGYSLIAHLANIATVRRELLAQSDSSIVDDIQAILNSPRPGPFG